MDGALPTFNFDYHFSSVNMARTTSDTSGYRSSHTPHQLRHTSYDNINRKRNFHQTDMGLSQSYSHSPATWLSTHVATSTHQPRIDEVQVYEPGDYCSKLANEAGAMQYATKKQRVNGFDENQPFPWSSTYAPDMCVPLAHNVAPSANMATSKSTHLSPCSLTSSEPLSRQSSVSSASVTDAFDMMRVESSFSTASDLFPLDPIDGSFVSCVTEKPASRQSTTGLNDGSASHSLSVMGYVGTDAFSFYSHDLSAGVAVCGQQNWSQAEGAPMASEKRASNNDLIELKASERRRKHIDNSRQCIAPKRSSDVRAGRSSKPRNASGGSHLQHGPTTSISTSQIDPKPSTVKRDPAQLKEPISKTPYVRPQHPKLYCNMCEDSGGEYYEIVDHSLQQLTFLPLQDSAVSTNCGDTGTANTPNAAKSGSACNPRSAQNGGLPNHSVPASSASSRSNTTSTTTPPHIFAERISAPGSVAGKPRAKSGRVELGRREGIGLRLIG